MNYFIIDQDDNLISISQEMVNKSNILNNYFKKNPKKVYKIPYPKIIIDEMIKLMQGLPYKKNFMLGELCNNMDIDIPEYHWGDSDEISVFSFVTEINVPGIAKHIFDSIFFEGNKKYHNQYVESFKPPEYNYLVTDLGITTEFTSQEFKKSYTILTDNKCVKNNMIPSIINTKQKTPKRQYKQMIKISYNYATKMVIPMMQIIIDEYYIGNLINGTSLGMGLNADIFDMVINLLIEHYNTSTEIPKDQIIEIQKKYEIWVIIIKRIHINEQFL